VNPIWLQQSQQWARIGTPLRPSQEDTSRVEALVTFWQEANRGRRLRALLLGVTPELATLRWPEGTSLIAVDRSEGMIATVWPKQGTPEGAKVVCGDWQALPVEDARIDVIVGDGAINALPSSELYEPFTRELRRVLDEGGQVHLRTFVAPAARESLDAVAADVRDGRIRSFHALKWRIAMAVDTSIARGTVLGEVWDAFRAIFPDDGELAAQLGCDRAAVETIHTYRGSTAAYTFPTLVELRAAFEARFVERSIFTPSYELGERCLSIVFQAK
jgi:SAM-dependent methyltransferase